MAGLRDLILKENPYEALDLYDPAAERRQGLYQLMIQQAMSNPSMTSPLLALVGALGYGRSNQNELGKINQLKQGRQQFMGEVQKIASSGATPDEKINQLVNLKMQYGSDFGMDIDGIAKLYSQQANRGAYGRAFTTDEEGNPQVPSGMEISTINAKGQPTYKKKKDRAQELSDEIAKKELMAMAALLPKLGQASQAVDQLENLFYEGAKLDKNPIAARLTGPFDAAAAKAGFNSALNIYMNDRKAFAGLIAKGGFGEAGMLTKDDITRAVASLPNAGSTLEEAQRGFLEVKTLLSAARNRYLQKKEEYLSGTTTESALQPQTTNGQAGLSGNLGSLKSKYGLR